MFLMIYAFFVFIYYFIKLGNKPIDIDDVIIIVIALSFGCVYDYLLHIIPND